MKLDLKNTAEKKKINKQKKTRMAIASMQGASSKEMYKHSGTFSKIIIIVLLVILTTILIFLSGVFDISEIIVEGNNQISKEQIISFSEIKKGANLFSISKQEISDKLTENPYIKEVAIQRILPDKIKLSIQERKVDYVLELASSYIYIDEQGFVLEISSTKPDVPIIIGFATDLSNMKENNRLNNEDLVKMNMVIKITETAKANDMMSLITKIDVSDANNYTIYLDNENKIAYLGDGTELNTRFLYIKSILKEQAGKAGEIFVNMNLNSDEYVYFRENI